MCEPCQGNRSGWSHRYYCIREVLYFIVALSLGWEGGSVQDDGSGTVFFRFGCPWLLEIGCGLEYTTQKAKHFR